MPNMLSINFMHPSNRALSHSPPSQGGARSLKTRRGEGGVAPHPPARSTSAHSLSSTTDASTATLAHCALMLYAVDNPSISVATRRIDTARRHFRSRELEKLATLPAVPAQSLQITDLEIL